MTDPVTNQTEPPSTDLRPTAPTSADPTSRAPASTASAAAAASESASVHQRRRPVFATILWGVVLLAFAAFMAIRAVLPGLDLTLWLLGGVIAIGLLLVVVGIIAASRRAG